MAFNFDNFNIPKLLKIVSGITNPKQGLQMALDAFSKRYPDKGKEISSMIKCGVNPKNAIVDCIKNGDIGKEQLDQLKQINSMAKRMGIKMNIPNSVFKEAEKLINSNANNPSKNSSNSSNDFNNKSRISNKRQDNNEHNGFNGF